MGFFERVKSGGSRVIENSVKTAGYTVLAWGVADIANWFRQAKDLEASGIKMSSPAMDEAMDNFTHFDLFNPQTLAGFVALGLIIRLFAGQKK